MLAHRRSATQLGLVPARSSPVKEPVETGTHILLGGKLGVLLSNTWQQFGLWRDDPRTSAWPVFIKDRLSGVLNKVGHYMYLDIHKQFPE
jgi:hypothetical protein